MLPASIAQNPATSELAAPAFNAAKRCPSASRHDKASPPRTGTAAQHRQSAGKTLPPVRLDISWVAANPNPPHHPRKDNSVTTRQRNRNGRWSSPALGEQFLFSNAPKTNNPSATTAK